MYQTTHLKRSSIVVKRTRPPGPKMDDKSHFLRPQIFGIMKKKLYILCIPRWSQIYFPVELELVSSSYLMKCFIAQGSSINYVVSKSAIFSRSYCLIIEGESTLFWIFKYLFRALRFFPDLCLFRSLEYDCTCMVIEKVSINILDATS